MELMFRRHHTQIVTAPVASTALQNGQLVSRIFTDQLGQQFRLTFFVSIVNGEVRGRLVSAQPISSSAAQANVSRIALTGDSVSSPDQIFCLPIFCTKKEVETSYVPSYAPIVSPYRELYFFMSQPTRAPSGK